MFLWQATRNGRTDSKYKNVFKFICKGLILGLNKNTFFLSFFFFTKPTKGENQVAAAAAVLHLTLHWLHIVRESLLLFDSQKLWVFYFLLYYCTESTGSFFFFVFCLDKGAQWMLGDHLVGWRRNFDIRGLWKWTPAGQRLIRPTAHARVFFIVKRLTFL